MAGIRRPELASLLGVSVTTVNGWFSSGRTIPKLKQNAIEAIVKQARRPELKFDDIVSFSVRLTPLSAPIGKKILFYCHSIILRHKEHAGKREYHAVKKRADTRGLKRADMRALKGAYLKCRTMSRFDA